MTSTIDPTQFTSEKSLWDVYLLCKRIRPSKTQTCIVYFCYFLLGLNAFFLHPDSKVLLTDVRSWAALGFNFTITTLGFLIAGFTIFTTVAKPEMMLAMMAHHDKETGLQTLKKNMFAFLKVFIAYLSCSALYLSVLVFAQSNGLLAGLLPLLPNAGCIKDVGIKFAYIFVGGSFVYLLFMLKVFIFNIYIIVMSNLRWAHHQSQNTQKQNDPSLKNSTY
jgi:hypothetical protein